MNKIWTKEQLHEFIKENNVTDGRSLEDAFIEHYKGLIQAILEQELENELGYSKYDWKNKEIDNSRNGHSNKTIRPQSWKYYSSAGTVINDAVASRPTNATPES